MMDGLQELLFTLKQNKLRTGLTAFGVFWGIFMLVLLLGSGRGLQNGMAGSFSNDMSDTIWISAGRTSVPYQGLPTNRHIQLTESDMQAIREQIRSEEHTSELQSRGHLVCRLLLEKKNKQRQ